MATMIYVDQENGDITASMSSKDRVKFSSKSSNSASSKGLPTYSGKVFQASEKVPSRKALGNVNKQVMAPKAGATQKNNPKKLKAPLLAARKASVTTCPAKADKENYPEIENFFPYSPLDFERFEVPEEHKLSHICLAGVPLMVHKNEKFEALLNIQPAPMEMPPRSWESDVTNALPSLLDTLDDITLDMPPFEEY
ncbi:securin-like isoform 1-T2 [Discoglossus pictus]